MYEQIQDKLNEIRPYLHSEGGDIELVKIDEHGVVYVRLSGVCGSCPASVITLKVVVEKELNKVSGFSGIKQVS